MSTSDPRRHPAGQPPEEGQVPAPVNPAAPQPIPVQPQHPQQPLRPQPVSPQSQQIQQQAQQPMRPVPVQPGGQAAQHSAKGQRPVPVQQGGAMPREQHKSEEEEPEGNIFQDYLRSSPPWLFSMVVHILIIVILGLFWILHPNDESSMELTIHDEHYADELGDPNENDPLDVDIKDAIDESVLTPQELTPVEYPFAAPPEVTLAENSTSVTSDIAAPIGMALNGRQAGSKASLLRKYGGTKKTEAAVKDALAWLAKQQQKDGSWSLKGPYDDGSKSNNDYKNSATAMALLAFLGAGDTHLRGKYRVTVHKGLNWLIKQQRENGLFDAPASHQRFYTHGQCSIVLCEAYAMTKDMKLKVPAEKAIAFSVKNQAKEGGWRYSIGEDSDTSVTGWILMSMQSARMGGLSVPEKTFTKIGKFLNEASNGRGTRYSYQAGGPTDETMTAEGLLCRQYLGWKHDDERLKSGVEYLVTEDNLPVWNEENCNVYYWYYATQVLHHMNGKEWTKWNNIMRELLPKQQVKNGKEKGSWNPDDDEWGYAGGRLYVTCLSVFILEVYYRHLPIYKHSRK